MRVPPRQDDAEGLRRIYPEQLPDGDVIKLRRPHNRQNGVKHFVTSLHSTRKM
jgi:hypothetical protein